MSIIFPKDVLKIIGDKIAERELFESKIKKLDSLIDRYDKAFVWANNMNAICKQKCAINGCEKFCITLVMEYRTAPNSDTLYYCNVCGQSICEDHFNIEEETCIDCVRY